MRQIKERILNKNNYTLLHIAAKNDSIKIGELLISKGADINAKNSIDQIMKNHFDSLENKLDKIGELLISKGADINAKDIIYHIMINHF